MISRTHESFWACFDALPSHVLRTATEKFRLWRTNPFHPSLHFKPVAGDLWSVRVTQDYRALVKRYGDLVVWFWVGTHAEYDRLVRQG